MKEKVLQLESASTGYRVGKNPLIISKIISASISEGMLVALLGPNGSGKSTLLRSIAGLQPTLGGEVLIKENNIKELRGKEKAKLLSLVLTDRITSANFVVKDIVEIGRYPYTGSMGVLQKKDKEIVNQAIKQCQLEQFTDRMYSELSDGEKQRVMLARALAQDTPLMMLDEPTAHLDLPNRVNLMKMLRDLAKKTKKAILLSTHELDLALQWCDTIWLMNDKGELRTGVPEDLVLNDDFAEVFSNESFFFDKSTGIFKMKRKPNGLVFLTGEAVFKEWTKRALEREGFIITDNEDEADFSIDVKNHLWKVLVNGSPSCYNSISHLLQFLSEIKGIS